MVCKNRGIYGFWGPSWVLITMVWLQKRPNSSSLLIGVFAIVWKYYCRCASICMSYLSYLVWTMAGYCIVYSDYCIIMYLVASPCRSFDSDYCITMYLVASPCRSFVTTELVSLYGRKNRHGHRVCWMSTARKNGFM